METPPNPQAEITRETAPREKFLPLPGGRTLAYKDAGVSDSSVVVIFFHGAFGVGTAPRISGVLQEKGVHYIAPTLPGWGNSSPPAKPFTACLLEDISALLSHLHPDTTDLKIIVSGGSYGTAPAQMIFGAPFDIFPYGRHIVALVLLAPFSPFRYHQTYTRTLTWGDYISVGPPARWIPFHLVQRLLKFILQWKLHTVDRAEAFLRSLMFDKMDAKEREAFAEWRSRSGIAEGQFEREIAEGMVRSVSKTWEGPFAIADVLHSDWGFSPATLDEAHAKPVLIAVSDADRIGSGMGEYLAETYPKACIKRYEGGHLAAAWKSDDLWAEALAFV